MKKLLYGLFIAAGTVLIFCGCAIDSPYDYGDNWLIRENDIPLYYSTFDLFYIGKAPADYGVSHDVQFNWAHTHTNDIFGRGVRVFSPKVPQADVENVTAALEYYLDHFHQKGHPFVLLAEGKAAELLYQAMRKCSGITVDNGFIAAYLPNMTPRTKEQIADDFYWSGLKAASGAGDYGVIVTWNSRINNEKLPEKADFKGSFNINPLNWKTTGVPGSKKENIKAVFYMPQFKNNFWRKVEEKNFGSAVINLKTGMLDISCPVKLLHVVKGRYSDNSISIFAGNIAANARARTKALIRDRQWGSVK